MALDKPLHCYICKQSGHFAPNCPTSRKNNQPLRTMPQRPTGQQNFPPCSITYNFDQVPYIKPIQPDSRTTTSKPTTFRQHNTPHSKPVDPNATKKAVETRQINPELFAEEEEEAEFVFENENLSAEPSGHRFNLREMTVNRDGQEVIWDSGALDNVTGDRYALFDFTPLAQPIAVKVATDTACDFITGTGTLRFAGMNKTTIAVKRVYYCEQARSTLLLIAAFKQSNAQFRVNGNFDSIDLMASDGRVLLRSTFDPIKNTWPLQKPIRASSVSSSDQSCNTVLNYNIHANNIFKSPDHIEHSQFTWTPEDLTPDEKTLLFWSCEPPQN
ncbi:hypothetical protein PTTG_25183 [Puccinia triticina 1-1 BBBD Race 1]|uniref:CCHC-type domain-containing protein n=1 Tax=Puccinia triticina (isolate 1-1 / race 1 (BBBD)) TaxID=630390 RepID=A0A180H6X0_PUCT1|nr:hypothetical protein PTTG_25183 [Puccinia triticina 1-1 BBBD Race 1]